MNTLKNEFELYFNHCYPKGARTIQTEETKQAFFAGALTALMMTLMIAQESKTDTERDTAFDALMKEAKKEAFARRRELTARAN